MPQPLPKPIEENVPLTALAPMQDVTDGRFMRLIADCGAPDFYFTEYFRVHTHSTLEPHIVRAIEDIAPIRPVFAQIMGESLPDIGRTLRGLLKLPIAGIDLNLGCPVPKVYKKNVGGGLLRDPKRIDDILGYIRSNVKGRFTVKMRIGFDTTEFFQHVLSIVDEHNVDLLSLHARTVKELYRGVIHYEYITEAVRYLSCPVLANGDIITAKKAMEVLSETKAAGVMIGRPAIRNPWIFRQVRELAAGREMFRPRRSDVREYLERIWDVTDDHDFNEFHHVNKTKKFMNFIGLTVDEEGHFIRDIRRARTRDEVFRIADEHLGGAKADLFIQDEPFKNLTARPNHEDRFEENCVV